MNSQAPKERATLTSKAVFIALTIFHPIFPPINCQFSFIYCRYAYLIKFTENLQYSI